VIANIYPTWALTFENFYQSADWEQFVFQTSAEREKVLEANEKNKVTALGDKGDEYKFDIETMSCCPVSRTGGRLGCAKDGGHEVEFRIARTSRGRGLERKQVETRRQWHKFQPGIGKKLDDGEAKMKKTIQIETKMLNECCKEHLVGQNDGPEIKIEVDYGKNVFWVVVNSQKRAYKLWKRERDSQQKYLYKDGDQPYMCHLTPKVQLNSKLDSKAYTRYMNCHTHFSEEGKE